MRTTVRPRLSLSPIRFCFGSDKLDYRRLTNVSMVSILFFGNIKPFCGAIFQSKVGPFRVGEKPVPKKVFISFDYDHDETLKTFLVGQAKHTDSPFELSDWSIKEPLTKQTTSNRGSLLCVAMPSGRCLKMQTFAFMREIFGDFWGERILSTLGCLKLLARNLIVFFIITTA